MQALNTAERRLSEPEQGWDFNDQRVIDVYMKIFQKIEALKVKDTEGRQSEPCCA